MERRSGKLICRDRRDTRGSWRMGALVGGLALAIQAAILGLAIVIGVMDPPMPKEAKLKLPVGSESKFKQQQQQISDQLAKMNRLNKAELGKLMQPLMQSLEPEIPVPQPDLVQSVQAMGAMLPMENFFRNDMAAFTDGLETDTLPPPDPVSFLGESLNAKRIVLLLDVSSSVKTKVERAGLSMEKLRMEVHNFVDQLGPNHLFGIIQFTRNWDAFQPALSSSNGSSSNGSSSNGSSSNGPELLPATEKVRQQARDWINRSFRTTGTSGRNWTRGLALRSLGVGGNGIEGVLAAAFAMDPQIDEIFIVSDGDFQRTPPGGGGQDVPMADLRRLTKQLQERSIHDTRLRFLCFYPPEEVLPDLRAWVRENGTGSLRVFSATE